MGLVVAVGPVLMTQQSPTNPLSNENPDKGRDGTLDVEVELLSHQIMTHSTTQVTARASHRAHR